MSNSALFPFTVVLSLIVFSLLIQLYNGQATVHVGQGPQRAVLCAAWDNDEQISRIIHELHFGAYRLDAQKECRSMRGKECAA